MNLSFYFLCLVAGLLGILFHTILKMQAVKKRVESAGIGFSFKAYLSAEWMALVSSILTVLIFIFILDEIVKIKPQIVEILKFFFIFVGYTGSSILQQVLGKTDKAVNKIINDSPSIVSRTGESLELDGNGAVIPSKGY